MATPGTTSVPLSGADWFLATAERMMLAAGQGEHMGLTVLRLGPGLDLAALRSAAARLAAASPIAAARLRKSILGVPRWVWRVDARPSFPVEEHRGPLDELCARRLNESSAPAVRFDVLGDGPGSTVVLRWRHLLLDAKGAELFLAEIARLAENADSPPPRPDSWGPIAPRPGSLRTALGEAERFKDHFYALARTSIRSLGGVLPRPGAAAFFVEEFSAAETAEITARATTATHELFRMGWFLAVAMRVHHAVLCRRGEDAESCQSNCPVQERKRGARHPIWQNHVSQLFFRLLARGDRRARCGSARLAGAVRRTDARAARCGLRHHVALAAPDAGRALPAGDTQRFARPSHLVFLFPHRRVSPRVSQRSAGRPSRTAGMCRRCASRRAPAFFSRSATRVSSRSSRGARARSERASWTSCVRDCAPICSAPIRSAPRR